MKYLVVFSILFQSHLIRHWAIKLHLKTLSEQANIQVPRRALGKLDSWRALEGQLDTKALKALRHLGTEGT